jgi:hypothetical protein
MERSRLRNPSLSQLEDARPRDPAAALGTSEKFVFHHTLRVLVRAWSLRRLYQLLEARDFPFFRLGLLCRRVRTGTLFPCCGKNWPTHAERCIHSLPCLALAEPRALDGALVFNVANRG